MKKYISALVLLSMALTVNASTSDNLSSAKKISVNADDVLPTANRSVNDTSLGVPFGELWLAEDEPTSPAPAPAENQANVISIFSDSYTDLDGTNFNPPWGQTTTVTEVEIEGNQVLKYENFNYQGIELNDPQDVSGMEFIHLDIWTADATAIEFFLISPGPSETSYPVDITQNEWISVDIPVSEFSSVVNVSEVFQFKFTDGETGESPALYIDNIYFYKLETSPESNALLSSLTISGEAVPNFNPNTFNYEFELPTGATEVPEISGTASNSSASVSVEAAPSLPGTTTVTVVSEDETATKIYEVEFVLTSTPQQAAPTPGPRDEEDVISIFSGAYTNVQGVNFDPNWGQSTDISEVPIGDGTALKYDAFNYQGIEFSSAIDVSDMDFVHVDVWTSDASAVSMYLISPGPSEVGVSLPVVKNVWKSYDIPLSDYESVVDLTEVFQFKFDDGGLGGSPTVFLSNLYFYRGEASLSNEATLADLKVDGATIAGFSSAEQSYSLQLSSGSSEVPSVTATPGNEQATVEITPATELPGTTTVEVTAEDGETTKTYTVAFTLLSPQSDATLSSLTISGEEMENFLSTNYNYVYSVKSIAAAVPEVSASTNHNGATAEVIAATSLPGNTVVKVVSEDSTHTQYYTVFFKTPDLLWWDEFTDPAVNEEFWTYETGDGCEQGICGWGNEELQVYREQNISIEAIPDEEGNSAMVIKAESTGAGSFGSGRIKTEDKVDIKFGKLEVRVQVPDLEVGLWPAVWLLGSNNAEVGWPQSGELDIMEMGQKESFRTQQGFPGATENQYTGSNIIWYASAACVEGNPTCAASTAGDAGYNKPYISETDMNSRFQIYRLYWTDTEIRFTVEDEGIERDLYEGPFELSSQELQDPFHKNFFLTLNMAVGGDFTDAISAGQLTAPLPAKMYIDYVRLHKLNGQGQVTLNGIPVTNEPTETPDIPENSKLYQNYPNPFNPTTQIVYELKTTSSVQLKVSDMLGRTVAVLESGRKSAGNHSVRFDAARLSSGVYIYSLILDGSLAETKKMMLIK